MAEFPAPLTPADCDLRSVPSMLLEIQRFRDSDLVVLEKPEAVLAAILLWGASWHQVPAASLPDDDRMLAQLAGYGRSIPAWKKVKAGALRGFVKCSDGRLYHPVVAEKAVGMWEDKLKRRHNMLLAAIRKHNERKSDQVNGPSYEDWLSLGRPEKIADLVRATPIGHAPVTQDNGQMSRGQTPNVTQETASNITERNRTELNQKKPEPKPPVSESSPKPSLAREKPPPGITDAALAFEYVCREADWRPSGDNQRANGIGIINGWLALGCSLETILSGIASARRRDPVPTRSLKRFDSTIRGMRRDELGGELPVTPDDVRQVTEGVAARWAVQ